MTSYLHLKSIVTLLKIKMHKKNYVNAENQDNNAISITTAHQNK